MNSAYNINKSDRASRFETNAPVSVQAWKNKPLNHQATAQDTIEQNLNRAAHGKVGSYNVETVDNALSLVPPSQNTYKQNSYEFKDVLDIINPLHHIPIVGTIYRSVTGDELKPASRIIGGTIFGGPVGAVTSTLNAISEMQTGSDLNDRAFGMVGFAGAPKAVNPDMLYRRYQETDDLRTANWQQSTRSQSFEQYESYKPKESSYEPISKLQLSPMPPRTLIDT